MHIPHRIHGMTGILVALIAITIMRVEPSSTFALVASQERNQVQQAFVVALQDAANEYQRSKGLPALKEQHSAELQERRRTTAALMREKRISRMKIAALRTTITLLEKVQIKRMPTAHASGSQSGSALHAELTNHHPSPFILHNTSALSRPLFVALLGNAAQEYLLVTNLHQPLLLATENALHLREVSSVKRELNTAENQYAQLLARTNEALLREDETLKKLQITTEQFEQIQQNMQEVHAQILRMQSELARIDTEIRARIEQELIEKGLLTPGTIDHAIIPASPQFSRPVYGRITAGFLDASYREHFGIPHYGLDMAVAQGSPVFSAADGVVFLARDGGATKYSYVLIGHRDGFATLYGHLSQIAVTTGQNLHQGEFIGLSGGAKGKPGSGPTTTGPHLHFEVLEKGQNIDPASVLPH